MNGSTEETDHQTDGEKKMEPILIRRLIPVAAALAEKA
eukprot:CAMPEP_0202506826 /NCGR_PEP_ID=MMETSP1361-20130828/51287_1 /ASSEMBLY_ACC=CAM_ASM_000849 /TAXON_ID=210615 /ORGANISM="Staurosira complex sp., Strain CCMP2646" /LENGTH=37 /DNA_ID= /DNA_START= /DNA_END= /DNA_ORIENTATION=